MTSDKYIPNVQKVKKKATNQKREMNDKSKINVKQF